MCELLAYSSKAPQQVNHILEAFYKRSPYHPHGWGLGLFNTDQFIVQKEPVRAIDSQFLKRQLNRPLKYKDVLGHIRFATVGFITKDNTHPFHRIDQTGRKWVLVHNGTLFEDSRVESYRETQEGDTDSERIIMLLIDRINQASAQHSEGLSPEERFQVVDGLVKDLAKDNKLNLMIYDGEQFYIHANGKNQLHYTEFDEGTLISTTALGIEGLEGLDWKEFPTMRTHCLRDGVLQYAGEPHSYEYIPDPEVEKLLYLKYAAL